MMITNGHEGDFTYDDSNICLDGVSALYTVEFDRDYVAEKVTLEGLPLDVGTRNRAQVVAFLSEQTVARNEADVLALLQEQGREACCYWAAE